MIINREYVSEAPRIPRKKGQPAGSDKHSDLYTDENPKELFTVLVSKMLKLQRQA